MKNSAHARLASGGDHGNQYTGGKNEVDHDFAKTSKAETIRDMGFTEYQARDFQTLANHEKTAQGFASSIPDVDGKNAETKTQTIHSMGFTDRQARDFQTFAKGQRCP